MSKLQKLSFILLAVWFTNCTRTIDKDEIVLDEYIQRIDGKYYSGDCEIHATKLFTGSGKYYHENGKVKGTYTIKYGLPEGHWEQFDVHGFKRLDLYFEGGKLIKKSAAIECLGG